MSILVLAMVLVVLPIAIVGSAVLAYAVSLLVRHDIAKSPGVVLFPVPLIVMSSPFSRHVPLKAQSSYGEALLAF